MNDEQNDAFKQVEIYRAANSHQAQFLVNLLKDEGIWATVSGDGLANSSADMGWAANPRVFVRQQDQPFARAIALDFEQQAASNRTADELDQSGQLDPDLLADIRRGEDWPSCPACLSLRIAVCPNCEQAGTDFEVAEFINSTQTGGVIYNVETEENFEIVPSELRLMCSICDRAFKPVYQKRCVCGHEFPDGLESQPRLSQPFDFRAFFVLFLFLVAVVILVFIVYSILN